MRVLLTDNVHFHERNFKSLFTFFAKKKIEVINAEAPKDWIALYGDYTSKSDELNIFVTQLSLLSKDDLFKYTYKGIKVFDICKLEFLSSVLAKVNWRKEVITSNAFDIFNKAFSENYDALLFNMAAVEYWIDWWHETLSTQPHTKYACIFSGSLIYSQVLMEILKKKVCEPLVFESFFTGNEYYCELKYQHIPNNSDLKFEHFYKRIKIKEDTYQKDRMKAINKIILTKNKNVIQPEASNRKIFNSNKKTLLILGQVINDFSIIGDIRDSVNINSLHFYKQLIASVIKETDLQIIFKAHPWESKKTGVNYPVTREELNDFIRDNFTTEEADRVIIIEEYNLKSLFEQSDLVATLCSQAAIEAAFEGFKPFQFGNAFFGNKGFTFDFTLIDQFIEYFKSNKEDSRYGLMSISEYDLFEEFLVKTFCYHLVTVHKSGELRLAEIFDNSQLIKLSSTHGNVNLMKSTDKENATVNRRINNKKFIKFQKNPYAFFRDSHPILRPLKIFFKS